MNTWRRRLAIWLAFLITGKLFDMALDGMPSAPVFWLLYYGGAAMVDLFMFRVTRYFVSEYLRRDIEAICIASVSVNALGWALKQLAQLPPDFYNHLIAGLNYALIIRLFLGDRDVLDLDYYRNRFSLVLRNIPGYQKHAAEKEER